jgi:hypothetical protein
MKNKRLMIIFAVIIFLLLIPLIAMQFTDEVNWTLFDFIVMGILLTVTGLSFEMFARKAGNWMYKAAAGLAVLTAFLLIWINLAVGIIRSENNSANLMFAGVLAAGFIGSIIARFRPRGMAYAMIAAAIVQMIVAVIVEIFFIDTVFPISVFFTLLWLASAYMFRKSEGEKSEMKISNA